MSLRRKYVNSTLETKTCSQCHKTYPRNKEFFYGKSSQHSQVGSVEYYAECISCGNERSLLWKKKNNKTKIISNYRYLETETGYFKSLWQGVIKSKHGSEFLNYEEFFQCWIEQQKIYGRRCPYFNFEMTKIKGINRGTGGKRRKATATNISKDRILTDKPYGKNNMMFISWKANNQKGNVTPEIAKRFLEIVNDQNEVD